MRGPPAAAMRVIGDSQRSPCRDRNRRPDSNNDLADLDRAAGTRFANPRDQPFGRLLAEGRVTPSAA